MEVNKRKIILVDDNIQFRTNLKNYIESDLNCIVIAEASNGNEFILLPNIKHADVILMDIAMDGMDGFEATQQILWKCFHLQIIAITMHMEKVYLVQLLETGFKGCVFKSDIFNHLRVAIDTVMNGKFYFPQNILVDREN